MNKNKDYEDDDDCSSGIGRSFLTFGLSENSGTPQKPTAPTPNNKSISIVQFLAMKKQQYDSLLGLEPGQQATPPQQQLRQQQKQQQHQQHQQQQQTRSPAPLSPEEVIAKLQRVQARAKPTKKETTAGVSGTKKRGENATNKALSPASEKLIITGVKPKAAKTTTGASAKTKPLTTSTPSIKTTITATTPAGSKATYTSAAIAKRKSKALKVQAARDTKLVATPPQGQAAGTTILRRTDLHEDGSVTVQLEHKIESSNSSLASSEGAVKMKPSRRQRNKKPAFQYVHYNENEAKMDDKRVFCAGDILLPPPRNTKHYRNNIKDHSTQQDKSILTDNIFIQGDPNHDSYLEIVGIPRRVATPEQVPKDDDDDDEIILPSNVNLALSCMQPNKRLNSATTDNGYPDGRSDDVFEDEEEQRSLSLSNEHHRPIQVLCTRGDQVQDRGATGASCLVPPLDASNVPSYPPRSPPKHPFVASQSKDNINNHHPIQSSHGYCHVTPSKALPPSSKLPPPSSPTTTMASCTSLQQEEELPPPKPHRRRCCCRLPKECGLSVIFCVSLSLFLLALTVLVAWYMVGYFVRGGTKDSAAALAAENGWDNEIPSEDGLYEQVTPQDFPSETQFWLESQDPGLDVAHAYQWLMNDPHIRRYPKWRQLQRFAMATLFYSTNGVNWSADFKDQWLSYEISECHWIDSSVKACDDDILDEENSQILRAERQGASNNQAGSRLRRLTLTDYNLHGTLPPEVSLLPFLQNLILSDNPKLKGTIPKSISMLSQLEILWASNCAFSGVIPTEMGLMKGSLRSLDLSRNSLGMGVAAPATDGSTIAANQLTEVSNHHSHHDGMSSSGGDGNYRFDTAPRESVQRTASDIPSEIGLCTLLTELVLSHNHLVNALPSELGQLTELRLLFDVEGNHLTGTLPTALGALTNLQRLYVGDNAFLGQIPSEMGNLHKLIVLDASRNQLTGSIPRTFVFWPSGGALEELWLYENQLTGQIPTFLPPSLRDLDLSLNRLDGTIPSKLASMSNLEGLWLYVNNLSGSIPSDLGNLHSSMTQLSLFGNRLVSKIPTELGRLTHLAGLWLDENELTGSVPTHLQSLTVLRKLDLHSNQLQGPLPDLGQFTALEKLGLQNNQFSGVIPASFQNLKSLKELKLDNNYLIIGPIPSGLGSLPFLTTLTLVDTSISGNVPGSLCELKQSSSEGLTIFIDCVNVNCDCDCKCGR